LNIITIFSADFA